MPRAEKPGGLYNTHTHTHFKYAGVAKSRTWLNDSTHFESKPSNKVWLNNCIHLTEPLNLREAGASRPDTFIHFLKTPRKKVSGILCYNLRVWVLSNTHRVSKAWKSHFSPGYGPRGRGVLGRWPRTSLKASRGPSEGSREKGVGSSRPRPSWLTPPLLPRAGPGWAGRHCPQAKPPLGARRETQQTEGDGKAVHPPVRWRDGEESACQQLPGNVPLLRPQQQQPPPLAPRLPPAHKEGWAAAATARA